MHFQQRNFWKSADHREQTFIDRFLWRINVGDERWSQTEMWSLIWIMHDINLGYFSLSLSDLCPPQVYIVLFWDRSVTLNLPAVLCCERIWQDSLTLSVKLFQTSLFCPETLPQRWGNVKSVFYFNCECLLKMESHGSELEPEQNR